MKVFISHKQEDEVTALTVAGILRRNKHTCYLDVVDESLDKNGDDLAGHLREKMGECDSLIAVVSPLTTLSWWVPWEIGVATEKDYPLSTYLTGNSAPPEYMKKWPVLRSMEDLNKFAQLLSNVGPAVLRRGMYKSLEVARRETAAEFHSNLKKALGQIF